MLDDVAPAVDVEPDRGLVQDQEARPVQQRPADLDPALHSAAERAHLAAGAVEQAQARSSTSAMRGPRPRHAVRAAA